MQMIEWMTANWEAVVLAIGALLGAAVAIAKLTPTKKDDVIVEKAQQVFDSLTKKK
jgi:hypothetical protein